MDLEKGVGSLLTGWLYKELGMRWAWRVYGISSLVLLIVYFIVNKTIFKKSATEMVENQRELDVATHLPTEQSRGKGKHKKDKSVTTNHLMEQPEIEPLVNGTEEVPLPTNMTNSRH